MKATILPIGLLLVATAALADSMEPPIPGLPPEAWVDSSSEPSTAQKIAAIRHLHVSLPATTPFDADPEARLEYRRAYRKGYRFGMAGFYNILYATAGAASSAGFYAGRDAGTLALSHSHTVPPITN